MRSPFLWAPLLLSWPALLAGEAQEPPGAPTPPTPAPGAPPTFAVGTSSVVLDVVVRDRRGGLVEDLEVADFDVREDGARQSVESFRVVARRLAASPPAHGPALPPLGAAAPGAGPASVGPAPVLAFVFDRLSPAGRDMARRAAAAYLATAPVGADLVGVYAVDLALHTVQPFTRDPALIQAALERATSCGHTALASATSRADVRERIDTMANADAALGADTQLTGASGRGERSTGSRAGQTALAKAEGEIEVRLQRSLELLERSQQGYATAAALRAVVETLAGAPGRKTVLLFSEGLALPANVQPSFRALVARANEVNVSFYAMDAGGLRVASPTAETALELRQAGERRLRQNGGAGDPAAEGSVMRQLERNEDLLRLDPRSGLGQLAEETGGFLISDTNDAAASLRRLEEDMRFHWVLSYSPTNEKLDGRFRRLAVRVRRPGVSVQARKGYVADRRARPTAPSP